MTGKISGMARRLTAGLVACAAALLAGCGPRYRVDYGSARGLFEGARDSYAAGESVTLRFPYVATDTNYHFELEGAELDIRYEDSQGFILSFIMPERDVRLSYTSTNTMVSPEYGGEEP